MPHAPAEDAGESEPSDEDTATLSAESRDTAEEDRPGSEARAQGQDWVLEVDTLAAPQESGQPEDAVDLLGLHSEPAPPAQAAGVPPSNADLLSCLLGTPEAAPKGHSGDLLGGETPLLFESPAPPTSEPATAGTCGVRRRFRWCSLWPRGLGGRLWSAARTSQRVAITPQSGSPAHPELTPHICPPSPSGCCLPESPRLGHQSTNGLSRSWGCLVLQVQGLHSVNATCSLDVSAADPFDPLLLTAADPDAQPCSKPDLFGEFLNADTLAAPSSSFPSTHSAPPPACSTDFLQLGELGQEVGGRATAWALS